MIDKKLAGETRVLPLGRRGNRLSVAMSDPTDLQSIDRIKFQAEAVVDPIIVEHDKLMKVLEKFVKTANDQLSSMIDDSLELEVTNDDQAAQVADAAEVDDAPVVKFLQKILLDGIQSGASDIHFEPYEKFYRIRFRIDGELREITQPPLAIKDKLSSRIKVILATGYLREANPAGRSDEARHVRQPCDRFPGVDTANAVRRKDRDAYSRSVVGKTRHRSAGL